MPLDRKPVTQRKILFVCVENSNRSQMAEAFARLLSAGRFEAASAGSRPSGRVNPKAIVSMAEIGYDLSAHQSKGLGDLDPGPYAAVVTMGCGDACPAVAAERRIDWQIPDPRDLPPDQFRKVRDLIRDQVAKLLAELG